VKTTAIPEQGKGKDTNRTERNESPPRAKYASLSLKWSVISKNRHVSARALGRRTRKGTRNKYGPQSWIFGRNIHHGRRQERQKRLDQPRRRSSGPVPLHLLDGRPGRGNSFWTTTRKCESNTITTTTTRTMTKMAMTAILSKPQTKKNRPSDSRETVSPIASPTPTTLSSSHYWYGTTSGRAGPGSRRDAVNSSHVSSCSQSSQCGSASFWNGGSDGAGRGRNRAPLFARRRYDMPYLPMPWWAMGRLLTTPCDVVSCCG
jgi:hypothetical protein